MIQSDTSAVVHSVVDSLVGEECAGQPLKGNRDISQFASLSVSLCSNSTDEGNEGKGGYK